ncbi:glycogenin 1, isoform CRA_b [Rattus norvegicus]|uniref:Glycogenin 1, isoform CRA_b n=1 Tax=Rattus norvegicus TaxID=10116 RepID=A6IHD0_RAT|nr:glycogenin 1, isoform CRA_b [Rattus norvegicus]
MTDQAFVTLTTNDAYAKGALVLGSSLKQHRTTRRTVVLASPQVSDSMSAGHSLSIPNVCSWMQILWFSQILMIFLKEKNCQQHQTQGGLTVSILESLSINPQLKRITSCCILLLSKVVLMVGTRAY